MPRPKLFLPWTPATRQQTCICCHIVRNCKMCCNKCEHPCNVQYDCELKNGGHGCEWWNNLVKVFDWEVVKDYLPEELLEYANKYLMEDI